MAISNSSRAVLNVELARLRAEKQKIQKYIDGLKVQADDSKKQIDIINNALDKIKADIDAV